MKISHAFDEFESALKSMRAAEIAALGADGQQKGAAAETVAATRDNVRAAAISLWSHPARGPSDLVLKARALRWHFPDGVEIGEAIMLGGGPTPNAPLGAIAVHYIVRDLLALAE